MTVNLVAICKNGAENVVKHVRISASVQNQLEGIFIQQEQEFLDGITTEILFDGGWNPEDNELLYAEITPEAQVILDATAANIASLEPLDARNFRQEGIKALAVAIGANGQRRLLLQNFSAVQMLDTRYNLFLSGDTFNRLSEPGFSLGTSLAGVVDRQRIKFKHYQKIKRIFDLTNLYKEATEAQLEEFCGLEKLTVGDVEAFKKQCDQRMRKLVNAITQSNTLGRLSASQIAQAAASTGFTVELSGNSIVMPPSKKAAKALLHFLDDGLYKSPLTNDLFLTNSKRRFAVS